MAARIKYTGPIDPLRIQGVGPVGKEWTPCPDNIAREFDGVDDFKIEFDKPPSGPPLKKGDAGGFKKSGGEK